MCIRDSEQRLEPQAKQLTDVHFHQPFFEAVHHGRDVHGCVSHDYAGCLRNNLLCRIKDAHDYSPGVGYNENGARALEHPFKEHGGFYLMEVVAVSYTHLSFN